MFFGCLSIYWICKISVNLFNEHNNLWHCGQCKRFPVNFTKIINLKIIAYEETCSFVFHVLVSFGAFGTGNCRKRHRQQWLVLRI